MDGETAVTFEELLEAGTHFGHQTRRWHPKMKPFVLTARNGIYIIDLQKTIQAIEKVRKVAQERVGKGGKILFVGTKKQAQAVIKEEAERSGMFYVRKRWLGGMLTNFQTVRKSIKQLDDIDQMEKNETLKFLTKKEVSKLMKKREKLLSVLEGVREMKQLPDMLFIIDAKKEAIAIAEANRLGIPVSAIVDTNADPDMVTYPIPGNDDAIKSIRIITKAVADAVVDVTGGRKAGGTEAAAAEAPKTEGAVETAEEKGKQPAPKAAKSAEETEEGKGAPRKATPKRKRIGVE